MKLILLTIAASFLLATAVCEAWDAVQTHAIPKPTPVRIDGHTVAIADGNNHTLTLKRVADVWVCAEYESGRSCRAAGDVVDWLLQNGDRDGGQ